MDRKPYTWINKDAVFRHIQRLFVDVEFKTLGSIPSSNNTIHLADPVLLEGELYQQAYVQIDMFSPKFHYHRTIDDESDLLTLLSDITHTIERYRRKAIDENADIAIF